MPNAALLSCLIAEVAAALNEHFLSKKRLGVMSLILPLGVRPGWSAKEAALRARGARLFRLGFFFLFWRESLGSARLATSSFFPLFFPSHDFNTHTKKKN